MRNAATDISSQDQPGSAAKDTIKVIIAAGGTGGHVYPAIAIADALQEEYANTKILFIGTKNHMEWKVVPKAGYDISSIWISGFHRRFTLKNLLFPFKLTASLVQSFSIISRFEPNIVISCGGYVAGPVGWVAAKKGIPLVIQEQNSFPGVTNRILGRSAKLVFTAFKEANQYFSEEKTSIAGNPIRKSLTNVDQQHAYEVFNFIQEKQTLLVLGGSGGAKSINNAMTQHIAELHDEMELQIIWQCGTRYFDQLRRDVQPQNYKNLRLKDFLYKMPEAYAVADLVISRAGALSCSELALTKKPSILVPSPNVAGDHQTKNANSMVQEGAAELIRDDELQINLAASVKEIITDQQRLQKMSEAAGKLAESNAAQKIAKEIINLVKKQNNNQ